MAYIDKEETIRLLSQDYAYAAAELVKEIPAADVAPVVHGAWVYDPNANDWGIGGYICSECKSKNNNLPFTRMKLVKMFSGSEYCPNCGAKMEGEKYDG